MCPTLFMPYACPIFSKICLDQLNDIKDIDDIFQTVWKTLCLILVQSTFLQIPTSYDISLNCKKATGIQKHPNDNIT